MGTHIASRRLTGTLLLRTANEQEFERQALKVLREQNWIAKITRLARMFTRIMSRT